MNEHDKYWVEPILMAKKFLSTTDKIEKAKCRNYVLNANYRDLFRIQIYKSLWEQLVLYPDVFFRRQLFANSLGLSQQMIREVTGVASGTVHNLLNTSQQPLSVSSIYMQSCVTFLGKRL